MSKHDFPAMLSPGSAGAVGSAPKSVPVQGTTAKGRLGKGVSVATATRESSRIREAAAAAEEAAGGKSRHLFGEGINKAVKAAVHDAVNGLVGHKYFVKQLSCHRWFPARPSSRR